MINQIHQLVEKAITSLGVDPVQAKGEAEGQWNLNKGDITIMLDAWEEKGIIFFQVISPVCELPENDREDFYAKLLQENFALSSMAYSIQNGIIYLKHTREAEGLTESEIISLINKASFYNEIHKDVLFS